MPITFSGGPLDGQGTMTDEEMGGMEPPGMPPGAPMAAMAAPPGAAPGLPPGPPPGVGPEAPPEEVANEEGAMFRSLLESIRALLALDTLSEKNKLALEKASTLVQQIKADEEKDVDAAMTGKLNPGVIRRLGSGPSY